MEAGVCNRPFPLDEMGVLSGQALKLVAFEGVVLAVFDTCLDLALVPGHGGSGGQHYRAIVSTELAHLGVEFRFKPITTADGGAQVVDNQFGRNTPEGAESVLESPDKLLGRLSPEHFAITLAGMTQNDTEEMRSTVFALLADHPSTLTEIDLGFLAGFTLPTAERKPLAGAPLVDEAFDRRIAPGEGMA